MNLPLPIRRLGAVGFVAAISLLLSACLVSPGKFTSAIDIRKDGRFSYSYQGEVFLLGLSKLAEIANTAKADAKFEESPCFTEDEEMKERKCTRAELDQQKADWEQGQKDAAQSKLKEAQMMQAMLGGIDPSSPKAAEELAERLRKQAGWKAVTYKGDGIFMVDFAVSGRIDHDFTFPTIERMPMANTFVVLNRRADGTVRIEAPAFSQASNGGGSSSFMQLAAMGVAMEGKKDGDEGMPNLPQMEGTLSLTTDATILANNTEEGPKSVTTGQVLEWKVNQRTTSAPMALVKLGS